MIKNNRQSAVLQSVMKKIALNFSYNQLDQFIFDGNFVVFCLNQRFRETLVSIHHKPKLVDSILNITVLELFVLTFAITKQLRNFQLQLTIACVADHGTLFK